MRQTTVTASDPYREIAAWYDLEHDPHSEDLSPIRHLVETVGDPVLELGCGSGRVLAALTQTGMRLTGVDTSPAMIGRCRERLAGSANSPVLVEADMAETGLESGTFGIVIIGLNTLLHASTLDRQRAVLKEAYRLLDPRGLLYLDVANPHAGSFEFVDDQVVREGQWDLESGASVAKFSARRHRRSDQVIATTVWYDRAEANGAISRASTDFELRYLYPAELSLMLELAGFEEWQLYGTYELDPYVDSSPRLIVTAEKTASV